METGKVVTSGSRLNVRTGAGMNYEIIDQLRPGEEVVVVGVGGDWYQITVPEKNGYVHSDYLELIEKAEIYEYAPSDSYSDCACLWRQILCIQESLGKEEGAGSGKA